MESTNLSYKILTKIKTYANLVMFSHTIFSLSFALISMLIAANGLPKLRVVILILVAFMGARTGANALNRLIDSKIDKKNPRTASRHLPMGAVKKGEVLLITICSFLLLSFAAFELNILCLELLPLALFLLIFYSYTKRFTFACHIVLGITCAAAPVGAYIAVTGRIGWSSLVLGAANALWVAGFDIIYGCQDVDFDRKEGLQSIPAFFGIKNALNISSLFHAIAIILLSYLYFVAHFGFIYIIGLVIVTALLIAEHRMVSPKNLTNAKIASYNINQVVSIVFLIFSISDIFILR